MRVFRHRGRAGSTNGCAGSRIAHDVGLREDGAGGNKLAGKETHPPVRCASPIHHRGVAAGLPDLLRLLSKRLGHVVRDAKTVEDGEQQQRIFRRLAERFGLFDQQTCPLRCRLSFRRGVALARQHSVLMIFEDAHWTDPTSLELFGRIVDRIPSLRVLLIVTFRPEFDPPWLGRPYVTALTINRRASATSSAIIDRVVGNKLLPANVRQDIIERTDGIPLFVEEMTKAVLEVGGDAAAQRTVASTPSPILGVPASLQTSLMARLDRLGPAKEIAQIGAAIGREFSHALLTAVVQKSEPELRSGLDRLIQAGLLFRQGVPPHASYLFKHALVQDAAYGTLLRERRRALHARIAETLESQFAEIAENQPELLARQCTEAALIEKAALLWGKAGQRSLERSALLEAGAQFTRALDQIAALPTTPVLRREQIKLQVGLTNALMHTKGGRHRKRRRRSIRHAR